MNQVIYIYINVIKERKKEGETKTKMEGNENTIRRNRKRGKNTRKKLMKYS